MDCPEHGKSRAFTVSCVTLDKLHPWAFNLLFGKKENT